MEGNNAAAQRPVRPFWDVERIVGKVTKNLREEIQVRHTEKDGRTYVDVRTFFSGNDGTLRPGKGIALPVNIADEVAGFVLRATETIRTESRA